MKMINDTFCVENIAWHVIERLTSERSVKQIISFFASKDGSDEIFRERIYLTSFLVDSYIDSFKDDYFQLMPVLKQISERYGDVEIDVSDIESTTMVDAVKELGQEIIYSVVRHLVKKAMDRLENIINTAATKATKSDKGTTEYAFDAEQLLRWREGEQTRYDIQALGYFQDFGGSTKKGAILRAQEVLTHEPGRTLHEVVIRIWDIVEDKVQFAVHFYNSEIDSYSVGFYTFDWQAANDDFDRRVARMS